MLRREVSACGPRAACAAALAALLLAAGPVRAQEGPAEAIASGTAKFDLRYRYEWVDQDGFDSDANASTVLLRLQYTTGAWAGWTGVVQFDHVAEVLLDNFNSGSGTSSGRRDRYPVVADPNGPDLNQLYLQYAPSARWRTRVGRQRILLDDQRYVGGVGWRQNEQTYDGLSVNFTGIADTEIFYSYVVNVNRIFGDEVAAGDHEQQTHLFNARHALNENWAVTGYAYLIDNDDAPAFSTDTYGLRLNGGLPFADGRLSLLGDVARQSDAGNAPASFDASYFRLQGDWTLEAWSAGIGFESLGSDNNQGFRTPLATLHAFNGLADKFLATPPGGLEDLYLKLGYRAGPWNLKLTYHDFSAEAAGGDYGTEIDLAASRGFGKRYSLLLQFATFDSDSAAVADTDKAWLMFTARF